MQVDLSTLSRWERGEREQLASSRSVLSVFLPKARCLRSDGLDEGGLLLGRDFGHRQIPVGEQDLKPSLLLALVGPLVRPELFA
jgi:hypothetical protein